LDFESEFLFDSCCTQLISTNEIIHSESQACIWIGEVDAKRPEQKSHDMTPVTIHHITPDHSGGKMTELSEDERSRQAPAGCEMVGKEGACDRYLVL